MAKEKEVISYRRYCRQTEKGTGLSHYILLTPKDSRTHDEQQVKSGSLDQEKFSRAKCEDREIAATKR